MVTSSDPYAPLAQRHGYPDSVRYRRVLEFLMTSRQAAIVVELPAPPEELAAKLDMPLETIKSELDTLFLKGVVFPKNFATRENPRFAREITQLHDASQSILDLDVKIYSPEAKQELFRLWEDFCENEWYPDRIHILEKLDSPPLRVIPAYAAIKDLPDIMPSEDMREILRAQQVRALCSCTCRKRRTDLGMACEHSHDINCFQFNRGAEYAITRGTGRQLSYEEALAIVDEIEQDGLVHNWRNDRAMAMTVMCHCCIDCCMIWRPVDTHGANIGTYWAKSRFQAQVDQDLCIGCQGCVERCMFDAIEMVKVPGSKKLKASIDAQKCYGCGACVLKCDPIALSMKTVRPPEHIPEAGQGFGH